MKTRFFCTLCWCALSVLALSEVWPTHAAAVAIWETTFNCPDWNTSMGLSDSVVCGVGDGLSGWGSWSLSNPDAITAGANYPGGAGGKGFRHWRGDGNNRNGGGLKVDLPAMYPELWIRFYMRYQAGFAWSPLNYTKELYLQNPAGGSSEIGFHGTDKFGPYVENPGRYVDGNPGWTTTMRGSLSDGQWHCYEVHVKAGLGNGVSEVWIDGIKSTPAFNDVNWGTSVGWSYFAVGSNQATPANGGDRYTDYDDLAVSLTGQLGCGSILIPPGAPTNVRILR